MSTESTKIKCQSLRELDALVAEKVMGGIHQLVPPGQTVEFEEVVPHYSTDIAAAWNVISNMYSCGWKWQMWGDPQRPGEFLVSFRRLVEGSNAYAATVPAAICLAALQSLKYDVELTL